MSPFQIAALSLLALLFIATVAGTIRGVASRREGFAWASLWLAVGVAIAWPNVIGYIARALGIGRGADLVLYCAVVVMLIGFSIVYSRLRRLRREITLLVRHLAIRDAINTADSGKPKSSS